MTNFSLTSTGSPLPPADAVTSTVDSSPTTVANDGVTTATITVTLKDADRSPVAGKTVTLASDRGGLDTISAASGLSDASGVVTFAVSSTTAGAPVFTATDTTDSALRQVRRLTQTPRYQRAPPQSRQTVPARPRSPSP